MPATTCLLRFFLRQHSKCADWKVRELKITDSNPNKLEHWMADRLEHSSHLAIFSFSYRQLEPGVFICCPQFADDCRASRFAATDVHAISKLEILIHCDNTGYFSIVGLGNFGLGSQQRFTIVGVVRQNQQPGRIHIKTSYGKHSSI